MKLIAPLHFVQRYTSVSRIAYGKFKVVVNIGNNIYTNFTSYYQAHDRIKYDDYLPNNVKCTGGLTLKQAYHAILSDIQISFLNRLYKESKTK